MTALPRKSVGRPRRLTLDAIVDAACEVGVANLEMGLVAERLNTGVATLYGYVSGRDHLLQLVTERLAGQSLIRDRGQSWQDILREHAAISHKLFQAAPSLITNLMGGAPDKQSVDYFQHINSMLTARGVSGDLAANAYMEINQVVIGAAVALVRRKALELANSNSPGFAAALPDVMGDYRLTLERIIGGYEQRLGGGEEGADAP
ncbi:MAG TPA: hypothetical protein VF489_01680 [Sphingobium sp.]